MKIISIFCLMFGATTLWAQFNTALISNLNQPSDGYSTIETGFVQANSFTTGSTAGHLVGASLSLSPAFIIPTISSYGVFSVGVYSDANGGPGTALPSKCQSSLLTLLAAGDRIGECRGNYASNIRERSIIPLRFEATEDGCDEPGQPAGADFSG